MSYKAKCKYCKKKLKDPEDNPVYLVPCDEYYCNQDCIDKQNKKELKNDK